MGRGVESPQGANTPGVAEVPRGDDTPGGTTVTKSGPREEGQGQGGDKNPPITRETRTQGSDGTEGDPMSGLRTAESPGTQWDTAADNRSAGPLPRQSDGANGARSKNGMLGVGGNRGGSIQLGVHW